MDIEKIKKQFGNEASNYTKYRRPYPNELYDLLFSLIPKGSKKILDVACGTGKSTEPLIESGLEVHGCDHDELMIHEAKNQANIKKLDIQYAVADAEKLPYEDNSFDAVIVGTAFHFFVNEKSMSEFKRVLKPGGLFFTFWTLTVKDVPEEDQIPGSIFQSRGWIKIPSELRDLSNISAFLSQAGLQKVTTSQIPFTYNATVEERVGLQMSSGSYELLPEEDKKKFLEEIREALTKNLGDRPYFVLEEEMQACYGFKSFVMKRPKILEEAGYDIDVDTSKLRDLPLPIEHKNIEDLIWCLDLPVWEKDGTDDWNLTPREVLDGAEGTSEHKRKIEECRLEHPIVIIMNMGKWVILDGIHRLAKAYAQGLKTIDVKVLTKEDPFFLKASYKKNYKAIILGPQCSGKTTLKKYLVEKYESLPLIEEDELFTELNDGQYPQDIEYKEKTLRPKLEEKIREADNLIFLTSYCNLHLLKEFKSKGFKVIQLVLEMDEFQRRNEKRMKEQSYADANTWAKEVFGFHQEVRDKELIDLSIDAALSPEEISRQILGYLE